MNKRQPLNGMQKIESRMSDRNKAIALFILEGGTYQEASKRFALDPTSIRHILSDVCFIADRLPTAFMDEAARWAWTAKLANFGGRLKGLRNMAVYLVPKIKGYPLRGAKSDQEELAEARAKSEAQRAENEAKRQARIVNRGARIAELKKRRAECEQKRIESQRRKS